MPSPFDDIFGGSGPQWTWEQMQARLDAGIARERLPRDLVYALVKQESNWDPQAVGDGGRARGFFQLHKGAAIDGGIDPAHRDDIGLNIDAGTRYLRLKLDQAKGDEDRALRLYNGGGDPNYVANVRRHMPPSQGQPTMMRRAASLLSPARAEAATPQQGSASAVWDDIFGAQQPAGATTTPAVTPPSPPTATSTPEQDAAYRQWAAQQGAGGTQPPAPASQTTPAPQAQPRPQERPGAPDTAPTPGMRFQALPSIQALPPAERIRYQQEFEALSPALQDEFLRSETPADLQQAMTRAPQPLPTPAGRAPSATPAPTGPASATQIEPITRGASDLVREEVQRPHEAGIPLSAVPAIAVNTLGTVGGAALGAPLGPVGSAAGAALGGSLATRANVAMGLAPQEKPLLETPVANVYPSDLLGAIPLGVAGTAAAVKGTVRNLPGSNVGRHEIAAEKLGELGQRMLPARPSSALFTEAAAQGGAVPTVNLWRAAGKVVREEKGMEKGFVSTEAMQAGSGLLDLMRKHGGNVPLGELEKYRQRLGQKIGTTTDRAELKRLEDLYGALHADLGQAATTGTAAGAGTLKAAIATKRKEHAHETLTDIWSPGKGLQLQEGAHVQVYGKRIRNEVEKRLHQDKLFAGSFTPAEVVDMRNTLREVGKLTRVTNPEAQGTVGSTLKWLGRLGGAGYGATTGDLLTGGAMILATEGTSAVLTQAMQSKLGRLALREAIREGNGTLTHGSLSAIAALLAREAAPEPPASAPTP